MEKPWARVLAGIVALAIGSWGALALHYDAPSPLGTVLGFVFVIASVGLSQRRSTLAAAAVGWAALLLWWFLIPASNERDWQPEHARAATAVIDGDRVTLENVRSFSWRSATDFDERWESRTYDLSHLVGIDVAMSDWGTPHIAHTIVMWVFDDREPLAISIEARREWGESYDPMRGLFRQYEIDYVAADERDVIALRTHVRRERVLLYQLSISAENARALLLSYLEEMNRIAHEPEWYHSVARNCSTAVRRRAASIGIEDTWDWRVVANGHLDALFYERGLVDTSIPFETLRARSEITERAQAIPADAPDFSARIREGLPTRRE